MPDKIKKGKGSAPSIPKITASPSKTAEYCMDKLWFRGEDEAICDALLSVFNGWREENALPLETRNFTLMEDIDLFCHLYSEGYEPLVQFVKSNELLEWEKDEKHLYEACIAAIFLNATDSTKEMDYEYALYMASVRLNLQKERYDPLVAKESARQQNKRAQQADHLSAIDKRVNAAYMELTKSKRPTMLQKRIIDLVNKDKQEDQVLSRKQVAESMKRLGIEKDVPH